MVVWAKGIKDDYMLMDTIIRVSAGATMIVGSTAMIYAAAYLIDKTIKIIKR